MRILNTIGYALGGLSIAFVFGFAYFLSEVRASERMRPQNADAIVVFSGHPKRIEVASGLLQARLAPQLIIVGQDNAEEIAKMRENPGVMFRCCVQIDARSKNTEQDAVLATRLLKASKAKSVILVTSSFHIPRARVELRRQISLSNLVAIGVDEGPTVGRILTSSDVASAFLSQYVLYLSASIPGSREFLDVSKARGILSVATDVKNIALVFLALSAALAAGYAFSRHRNRFR